MKRIPIHIGGGERTHHRDFIRGDPVLRRLFDVSVSENGSMPGRCSEEVHLSKIDQCDMDVGLFGMDYGSKGAHEKSSCEREFDRATQLEKHRLIYVKVSDEGACNPKIRDLLRKTESRLEVRRFSSISDLVAGLYSTLLLYLEARELVQCGPFDTAPCPRATLDDLNVESIYRFMRTARKERQFTLPEDAQPMDLLKRLDLLKKGRLTNAAVLLFGNAPQRFHTISEVKCALLPGTRVAKSILSYHVYKGTVFEMVDQAVDFVMSKIVSGEIVTASRVYADVTYEIPAEVNDDRRLNIRHRQHGDLIGSPLPTNTPRTGSTRRGLSWASFAAWAARNIDIRSAWPNAEREDRAAKSLRREGQCRDIARGMPLCLLTT